jgi:prepilin-type N-terminal cleavage/methylation domain-containing protein
MQPPQQSRQNPAFTIVELLAVIGIIGIIAALLLTVLSHGARKVKRSSCANNLRELGQAL